MSKSIWQQLGIPARSDKAVIRRAYASRLRKTNPEDDPEGFKRLRAAYEQALRLADQPSPADKAAGSAMPRDPDLPPPDTGSEHGHEPPEPGSRSDPASAPHTAFRQELDAAAAQVTSLLQLGDPEASEALPGALDHLLAQPALEEITARGRIEQWLAFQIASNFPRSDPLVNPASQFFGWDAPDYRARSPAIGAVLDRREIWTQIASFTDIDNALHAGWLALYADGVPAWRRRLQAIRPGLCQQVGTLIEHVKRTGLQDYTAPSAVQWWKTYLAKPRPEQALPLLPLCWLQAVVAISAFRGNVEAHGDEAFSALPVAIAFSLAYVLFVRPAISRRLGRPNPRRAMPELAIALFALLVIGMMLPPAPWSLLVGDGLVTGLLGWQGLASVPNAFSAARAASSRLARLFLLPLPCMVLVGTVDKGGRLLWALIASGLAIAWFRGSGTITRTLLGWKPWPRRCLLLALAVSLIILATYSPAYQGVPDGSYRSSLALLGCWGLLTLFAAFHATLRALILPIGYVLFVIFRMVALAPSEGDYAAPPGAAYNTASQTQSSSSALPSVAPARQVACPVLPQIAKGASTRAVACSPGEWIAADDYPVEALRHLATGKVSVAGIVGSQGELIACAVEKSSGNADLDRATCPLLQRRARFVPARDRSGQAIDSIWKTRVDWRLPS